MGWSVLDLLHILTALTFFLSSVFNTLSASLDNEAFGADSCLGGGADMDYGVDVSFPMHHPNITTNDVGLGDRQTFHAELIQRCVDYHGDKGHVCIESEKERVEMNVRQPQSMKNYTNTGFKKIRAPDKVWSLLQQFWLENKDNEQDEDWDVGEIDVNYWDVFPTVVPLYDDNMHGGGEALKQQIFDAVREAITEWTGQALVECSLYGIRVYKEGNVLSTHVDTLPLVSSAIINIAQDVDEPWPLEVIGHDGRAHNITMEPGDLVLYESHSIMHGRPFPLKGRFMANVFIHFEPIGPVEGDLEHPRESDLPPYIIPGSPEEANWRMEHPKGHEIGFYGSREDEIKRLKGSDELENDGLTGATKAHEYAQDGLIDDLKKVVQENAKMVNTVDDNGWTPLHEAARSGHLGVVEFLVDNGSDVNLRTSHGANSLDVAREELAADHPVITFLEQRVASAT